MVDVNINPEMKVVGSHPAPTMEREVKEKPQVAPVQGSSESASAALGEKELHRRLEQRKEEQARERDQQSFEDMQRVGEEIQAKLDQMGTSLGFSLHKDEVSEIVVARITNKESGDLIKQIPSEEVLKIRERLQELTGLLFDGQA